MASIFGQDDHAAQNNASRAGFAAFLYAPIQNPVKWGEKTCCDLSNGKLDGEGAFRSAGPIPGKETGKPSF